MNSFYFNSCGLHSFSLSATVKAWWWLELFASVLSLEQSDKKAAASIKVCESDELDATLEQARINKNSSSYLNLGHLAIWGDRAGGSAVFELKVVKVIRKAYLSMRNVVPWFYHEAVIRGTLPLHCAVAEINGQGVAIAASGGVGKTAAVNRLPVPWKVLCDDEALLVPENGGYSAHPFPTWFDFICYEKGRKVDVSKKTPLKAVFILERSEHDEVNRISQARSIISINHLSNQMIEFYGYKLSKAEDVEYKKLIFENTCSLTRAVDVFELKTSIKGRFWEKIINTL